MNYINSWLLVRTRTQFTDLSYSHQYTSQIVEPYDKETMTNRMYIKGGTDIGFAAFSATFLGRTSDIRLKLSYDGGGLIVPQFFSLFFFTKNLSPRLKP